MAEKEAEDLLQQLMSQIAIVKNDEGFKKTYGFYLKDYLENRAEFARISRKHADHIEKVVHDTGIARTTGGAVGIVSGGAAIAGIILAPFTAGASLALTVGGTGGGVASAGTTITAEIVRNELLPGAMLPCSHRLGTVGKFRLTLRRWSKRLRFSPFALAILLGA